MLKRKCRPRRHHRDLNSELRIRTISILNKKGNVIRSQEIVRKIKTVYASICWLKERKTAEIWVIWMKENHICWPINFKKFFLIVLFSSVKLLAQFNQVVLNFLSIISRRLPMSKTFNACTCFKMIILFKNDLNIGLISS